MKALSFPTWGLIPFWTITPADAAAIRKKTVNARIETIAEKPSFRGLVDSRRCAVLMDGFIEWRLFEGGKYPYHVGLPDDRPFLAAGLWDNWKDPETDTKTETFTVVTAEARGVMAQVHNTKKRMPFILSDETAESWLDSEVPFRDLAGRIRPLYTPLEAWPVSGLVSRPKAEKNVPEAHRPFAYPDLPPLRLC